MAHRDDEAQEQPTHTQPQPPVVSLCTPQSLVLLAILPFSNICGFLWCYTALPLHFLDSGWPLGPLSALLTFGYIPRVICISIANSVGDWFCVPLASVGAAMNFVLLLNPDSLAAVCAAFCATCAAQSATSYRSFVYRRFQSSGKWQMARALRIFTLADTLGYACAPFIGGLLYDNGGLRACAAFAASTCCVGMVLPLGLDAYQGSVATAWRHARGATCCSLGGASRRRASRHEMDNTVGPVPIASSASSAPAQKAAGENDDATRPPPLAEYGCTLWLPVMVVRVAVFTNLCVYGVEWCLYAIFFRLEYGWSGAWCGFAQMAGDLLGATVLGISTTDCVTLAAERWAPPRPLRALMRPPFGVTMLAYCHGGLLVMLAQPHFLVSLLGQVFMGTAYVFCEQFLQEMLLLYSCGDHAFYRRLISVHYLVLTAGASLCSPIAYGLYGASSFAMAFYASAALACAVGTGFGVYFAYRVGLTSAGVLGSLAAAEEELRARERARRGGGSTDGTKAAA